MSKITMMIKQANEELEQATKVASNLHLQNPELQELINAANLASQAAVTLNRLVGMRSVPYLPSKPGG
jgi:plasmid maintenance system antidote protein VapI